MTKKQAVERLITHFHNSLIADGITNYDEIDDEELKAIAKVLKLKL